MNLMNTSSIVQKLWNYCNVLRDNGMSYGDYPGSSPGRANNEAAPRLGHPASLYLLRPWSRVRPCTRKLSVSSATRLLFPTQFYLLHPWSRAPCVVLPPASLQSCLSRHYYIPVRHGIRTSLFSTVDVSAVSQDGRRACLRAERLHQSFNRPSVDGRLAAETVPN